MAYSFLKKETIGLKTQIVFIGKECEIFIPKYFFEDGIAEIAGEYCETVGLFWFKADGRMYECSFPVKMAFSYSENYSKKGYKLDPKVPAIDFDVFKLKTGDIFMNDTRVEQNAENISFFITKLIEGAKLPPYYGYDDVAGIFFQALVATGINGKLGVPAISYEFLLSELYRDKSNLHDEFRFAYNGRNQNDFKMVRLTKVPELLSSYTSITGEDITTQLLNSVIRTREHKKQKYSPLEKLIKY